MPYPSPAAMAQAATSNLLICSLAWHALQLRCRFKVQGNATGTGAALQKSHLFSAALGFCCCADLKEQSVSAPVLAQTTVSSGEVTGCLLLFTVAATHTPQMIRRPSSFCNGITCVLLYTFSATGARCILQQLVIFLQVWTMPHVLHRRSRMMQWHCAACCLSFIKQQAVGVQEQHWVHAALAGVSESLCGCEAAGVELASWGRRRIDAHGIGGLHGRINERAVPHGV